VPLKEQGYVPNEEHIAASKARWAKQEGPFHRGAFTNIKATAQAVRWAVAADKSANEEVMSRVTALN
jgi:hypothetical protein